MRIVIDTNVIVSGVFFGGWPAKVLRAWRDGRVVIVISPQILEEYRAVGFRLQRRFPGAAVERLLELLAINACVCEPEPLPIRVCGDPDDDKFLACALAGDAPIIVSGDLTLRRTSGYRGIRVLSPRQFVTECLG